MLTFRATNGKSLHDLRLVVVALSHELAGASLEPSEFCASALCNQAWVRRLRDTRTTVYCFSFLPTTAELASAGIECRAPASGPPRHPLVFLRP